MLLLEECGEDVQVTMLLFMIEGMLNIDHNNDLKQKQAASL